MAEVGSIIRNRNGRYGQVMENGNIMPLRPGQIITNPNGRRGYVQGDYSIVPIQEAQLPDIPEGASEEEKRGILSDFAFDFKEDMQNRKAIFQEISQAYADGEQGWVRSYLHTLGKVGAGAVLDTMGNTLEAGAKTLVVGLDKTTPDFLTDPLVDVGKSAFYSILESDVAQYGIEKALQGAEAYGAWKADNPRTARDLESVMNIGLLFAPVARGGTGGQGVAKGMMTRPLATVRAPLRKAGEALKGSAAASHARRARNYLENTLVEPFKELPRNVVKRSEVTGLLRTIRRKPSPVLQKAIDETIETGVVSSAALHTQNAHSIYGAIRKEAKNLTRIIRQKKPDANPAAFQSAMNRLDDVGARLTQKYPMIVGDSKEAIDKVIRQTKQVLDDLPEKLKGSPQGFLRARQKMDDLVDEWRGTGYWNKETAGPADLAIREGRDVLNDMLNAGLGDDIAKASLAKQRNLYVALDGIAPAAVREGTNIAWRTWEMVARALPMRSNFNNVMATFTGLGGLGAAAAFAPTFTNIALGMGIAYSGGRIVTSPLTRKFMGHLLSGLDEAIAVTRADRLMLQELTQQRELLQTWLNETEDGVSEVNQ